MNESVFGTSESKAEHPLFRGLPPCCVVAYDFTDESDQALHLALFLHGNNAGSQVHVINVQEVIQPDPVSRMVVEPPGDSLRQKAASEIEERVRERLDRVHRQPAWADITVHVVWGTAADEIARLATMLAADFIVVGTRPHRGLMRVLLGSTSDEVVRKAPCPVLVVHAPNPSTPLGNQKAA